MNFKKLAFLFIILWSVNALTAQNWPILKHYDENHISKVALPVGGIGTGTVSISGRGNLVDWEIMNRPGKGFSTVTPGNDAPFFAIFVYFAAVGMIYEEMEEEGLQVIRNIRARYDGAKRSPFDEAECGHHYARAMASIILFNFYDK